LPEIVAIRSDCSIEEITKTIAEYGHTRIPVYQESIDNIMGILNVKDLLKYWSRRITEDELISLLRKPYYIPETKNIHLLLSELKYRKYHMAIVIDEYGGTSGLVSIEDVLEQIVGDIQDEYDLEEDWLVEEPGGTVMVDARLPIEELEQYFEIEVERDKFDTVGGLVSHLTGRIPSAGEEVETDSLRLVILDSDERRIGKLRIARRTAKPEGSEE